MNETVQAERQRVGSYRLVGTLGEGGAARTWIAHHDDRGAERFAVKELQLLKSVHSKQVQLFERECSVLQDLDHPQIPRFIETLIEERQETMSLFLVQECIAGVSLQQVIDSGVRLTSRETVALLLSALRPLAYLHGRRPPLFHRDLKPSNLLLRDDGQCVLIDFGAVREALVDTRAGGSSVVGTFGYMAPEQFHARAWPATDLYALGATAIHLLSGTEPSRFPVRRLKPDFRTAIRVDDRLFGILDRLLEPAAEDRFSSTELLRAELEAWYSAEVGASPAPRDVLLHLYQRCGTLDPVLPARGGREPSRQGPISLPGVSIVTPEAASTSRPSAPAATRDTPPESPREAPPRAEAAASDPANRLVPVERRNPFWLAFVPGALGASTAGLLVLIVGGALVLYGALADLTYNEHVWKIAGAIVGAWGLAMMLVPRAGVGRGGNDLRKRGRSAPAQVTRIEKRTSFVGAAEWIIHFDYFSDDGFIFSNCVRVPAARLAKQVAEDPTMVVVRYAPEDASRSVLVVNR